MRPLRSFADPRSLYCLQVTAATERATSAEATIATLQAQVKKQETTINELNAKLADTKGSHSDQVRAPAPPRPPHPALRPRPRPPQSLRMAVAGSRGHSLPRRQRACATHTTRRRRR